MPKITTEFVIDRFYEHFAGLPEPERRGIIAALRATTAVMRAQRPEPVQPDLPLMEDVDDSTDD